MQPGLAMGDEARLVETGKKAVTRDLRAAVESLRRSDNQPLIAIPGCVD
jgi:hypothetical protein